MGRKNNDRAGKIMAGLGGTLFGLGIVGAVGWYVYDRWIKKDEEEEQEEA